MIETSFTVSPMEWQEAQRLWCSPQTKQLPGRFPAEIANGVLGASVVISLQSLPLWKALLLLISFVSIYVVASWRKKAIRKHLYKQATDRNEITNMRIDESGYFSTRPDFNECRMTWRCFTGWREGSTVFVLGRGIQFCIVPKEALSTELQSELRSLLVSKLGATQ